MLVGIYGQQLDDEKAKIFEALVALLEKKGVSWCTGPGVLKHRFEDDDRFHDNFAFMRHVDYVFTLGGDGTILQAVAHIGDSEVPVVGINLGRLGFLASIDVPHAEDVIDALIESKYMTSMRSMLYLTSEDGLFRSAPFALNDFTLHKRDTSSMITIHTYVNDEFLTSYWADGLIVSTPTGSTGYSLSCGGPIIMPNSGNFVITPVAPHNLNVRPIILSDDSEISFSIESRSKTFMCSMDSRFEVITSAHRLLIKKAPFKAHLVHLSDYSFLSNIRRKLAWGVDQRN